MDTAIWNAAVAAWQTADEARRTYNRDVYDAAWAAVNQDAPEATLTFTDTALDGSVAEFRVDPERPDAWDHHPRLKDKALSAIEAYQKRLAAEKRHNINAIDDEWNRLDDAVIRAAEAVVLLPAPDLPALRWKLEHLFGEQERDGHGDGFGWSRGYLDTLVADTRRLIGEASA